MLHERRVGVCVRSVVLACGAAAAVGAGSAFGQCGAVNTDLVAGYKATGPIREGIPQPTGAAWQFRRVGVNGPLLEAIDQPAWAAPAWGSPGTQYLVPCAGPIYSDVPAENENPFHDRQPSFAGIMMHPDVGGLDSLAIFTAQTTITIESFSTTAEVLGDLSNGVLLSASTIIGGIETARIGPTAIPYSTSGNIHSVGTGTPWTLHAGDKIVVRTNANGVATEDWVSVRADMSISGGPTLLGPPHDGGTCFGGSVSLHASAIGDGVSFVWQRQNPATLAWSDLTDGPSDSGTVSGSHGPTLTITGTTPASETNYRAIVSNQCGTVTSSPAAVRFCAADLSCDGFVDDSDFSMFVVAYNLLVCDDPEMPPGCPADLNRDGVVDDADFSLFVVAYNALLCP